MCKYEIIYLAYSSTKGHTLKEKLLSLFHQPSPANSFSARSGESWAPSASAQLIIASGNSRGQQFSHVPKHCSSQVFPDVWLLKSFYPPLVQWPLHLGERSWVEMSQLWLSNPQALFTTAVSFCIDQCPLNKETVLMNSESCIGLWLWNSEFWRHFNTIPF